MDIQYGDINFACRLSALLMQAEMTQSELAKTVGVSEAAVCRYLKGERLPAWPVIVEIAKALETTPEKLIADIPNSRHIRSIPKEQGDGKYRCRQINSECVRIAMKMRRMSIGNLAALTGLSPATVSRCINGKTMPYGKTLTAIAAALHMKESDLISDGYASEKHICEERWTEAVKYTIKPLLKKKGLSLTEVAVRLEISQTTIYRYFHASIPPVNFVFDLANLLNVSFDELLCQKEDVVSRRHDELLISIKELASDLTEEQKTELIKALK